MQNPKPFKSLLRFRQLREIVPLSRSEIYRRIALGKFPPPIKLGERVVAWDHDEIQAYVHAMLGAGASGTPEKAAQS